MPRVEIVYLPSCPNVAEARARLMRAFVAAKLTPSWSEHQADDPDLPGYARGFASPTILVDGRDVAGAEPTGAGEACRLYAGEGGARGAPSLSSIVAALSASSATPAAPKRGLRWRLSLAALPGLAFALLPKLACPACWPAYAGLLGSLGLGFLIETRWLLPLTAIFLTAALAALAYRARRRHGLMPFGLGIAATALVLAGKFWLESNPATYAGVALLVAASLWNTWPKRQPDIASCPACAPAGPGVDLSTGATKENPT